jgi:hypothetical protein
MPLLRRVAGDRSPGPGGEGRLARSDAGQPWWNGGLTALLVLVAVAGTGWYVQRFAVNSLYYDQWMDVNLIAHLRSGTLGFGTLWAQHNENRVLVPNLVVLVLTEVDHLDIRTEAALNAALWWCTCVLVMVAHRRRSGMAWLWYSPVVVVFASTVTLADTLFGFNLTWFLALAALAVSLFLLDRPELTPWVLGGAALVGAIGSYSSSQGLLIWPAGAVLLLLRRRPWSCLVAWLATAAVVGSLYFIGFDKAEAGLGGVAGPATTVRYFLISLGNVSGANYTHPSATVSEVGLVLGLCIFVVAVAAVVQGVRRPVGGAPLGVALVTFGLLFDASITVGRTSLGLATEGRFVVFMSTVWVGAYLALLGPDVLGQLNRAWLRIVGSLRSGGPSTAPAGGGGDMPPATTISRGLRLVASASVSLLVVLIVLAFVSAWSNGLAAGRHWRAFQLENVDVAVNIGQTPDWLVARTLGNYPPSFIRQMAAVAEDQRLSLFDTPMATEDARRGLFPVLDVLLIDPHPGAVINGAVLVKALVAEPRGLQRVEFTAEDQSSTDVTDIGAGFHSYAWVVDWHTQAVANGYYLLRVVADYAGGRRLTSGAVGVRVDNRSAPGGP